MSRPGSGRLAMGVDIEAGEPGSARAQYSVAIVAEDGRVVYSARGVPLSRVIRLAWEYRPSIIALDNVYELGQSDADIVRVLSLLPPSSEIIQVTAGKEGFQRLRDAARAAGLDLGEGKPSPLKTAVAAAILALQGVGLPVRSVEEKTIIVVSRVRSGKGGWSQQRFQRRGRAIVGGVANEIREALDAAGLDYDMYYRRSEGGIDSALFVVYAPIDRVRSVVKPYKGRDYTVKLRPVYKSKLLPVREEKAVPTRPVIVGLDPGVTTGVAIIDLDGRVLYADSGKGLDRGSLLDIIRRHGKPVVVAVDVREPPEAARKLAAQLGAEVYAPSHDLSPAEKREIVERHLGRAPEDSHVRDALAAALKAFNAVKSKMEQIEAYIAEKGIDVDADRVKGMVLQGLSLADALERVIEERLSQGRHPEPSKAGRGQRRQRKAEPEAGDTARIADMTGLLEALRIEKARLEERVRSLEWELERLQGLVAELKVKAKSDSRLAVEVEAHKRRIAELERQVEALQGSIEDGRRETERLLHFLWMAGHGELVAVRVVPRATPSGLGESIKRWGPLLKGEIVYVRNQDSFAGDFVRRLREAGVLGVLLDYTDTPLANALRRSMIPVAPLAGFRHWWASDLLLVERGAEAALIEEKRRLEVERRGLDLAKIVSEYRASREKELQG